MAQPVDIDLTREMTSSPDALWAVLSDLKRLPEWLAFAGSLEEVSSGAAVEGATYTVKPSRAFEPKTKWRIVTLEDRRRQVHASEMPMLSGVTSTIELQTADGGPASVHVHWHGEPSNLFGRLMRGMFQRQIEQNWRRSLEELDRVAGA